MSDTIIPDLIEPIIAWRAWKRVVDSDGNEHFHSLTRDTEWKVGETIEAYCPIYMHVSKYVYIVDPAVFHHSPSSACRCGIYSVKSKKLAIQHGLYIGRIKIWGKVLVYKDGYRSQFAQMIERPKKQTRTAMYSLFLTAETILVTVILTLLCREWWLLFHHK